MSSEFDKSVRDFVNTLKNANQIGTSPYDTSAEVVRIDGNTAWVHIPGGVDQTPVKLTTNAKKGDIVQVRVSGGKAWITGNETAPPTDDTTAIKAETKANNAYAVSEMAIKDAQRASEAAEQAETSAGEANTAALDAQGSADKAQESADKAGVSADSAMAHLSVVEDVAGVLNWIQQHGQFQVVQDTETTVDPKKWYYKYENDEYILVNPEGDENPYQEGWYELIQVDDAIAEFIGTHLTLLGDSLYIRNGSSQIKLSPQHGMELYNGDTKLATYSGSNAIIGEESDFHIMIGANNDDPPENEVGFYNGTQKLAYINGSHLYVQNSLSFGNFQFYERANGHFTLKFLGGN